MAPTNQLVRLFVHTTCGLAEDLCTCKDKKTVTVYDITP